MSIDKSLKRRGGMTRVRCVMTRTERITKMLEDGKFPDGGSPFGIPKTIVTKVVLKKKKEKTEGEAEAAPAAKGKAGAKPAAAAAPAAKPAAGGKK